MARPFDDLATSQYTGSSLSSQTSLPPIRPRKSYPPSKLSVDSEQTWNSKRGVSKPINARQGSSVTKIKSSSSHGAVLYARKGSSHGRLHKRGNSGGQTSDSSYSDVWYPPSVGFGDVMASAGSDPYSSPPASSVSKTKVNIKPLLRKITPQEQTSIDLSRSAAENEGLGIYNSFDPSAGPAYSEIGYGSVSRRGYHHRTTSGNSQMSTNTSSSNHLYGAHYVHPMRQTPRPYTPPIAASYQNSTDSEVSAATPMSVSGEGNQYELTPDASKHYIPTPPGRRIPPPLHLGPGNFSNLASSSQINLPGTPSSLRRQTDSINTSDIMPQTARSSLDSVFRKRSRTNTLPDPATQAATVQALRQKFNEKEAAKDLKFQQAEARVLEKEARKKEKREEEERRKSESKERKRAKIYTTNEKSGTAVPDEGEYPPSVVPLEGDAYARQQQRRGPTEKAGVAGKAVQGQWSLFWYKFRTMWLKLKKKMSRSST